MLNIQHPILLAGMGKTSGAPLAAAVCNAGGLGVIGGVGYTPKQLADMIQELKVGLIFSMSCVAGCDSLMMGREFETGEGRRLTQCAL